MTITPVYRCRHCGSASYQRLTHRGSDGVMQYSGVLRCTGCRTEFTDIEAWRERRLRPRLPGASDAAGADLPDDDTGGASDEG